MLTARGRVRDRHRVVEEHHDAVARELVERSLEPADERPQRAVVFAQKVEDLLGLGGLGKGGVTAQIAKHDDDLAPVGLSRIISSPCETISSASCGARNRFNRPTRPNSST
jgi:hypothetical protein